MKSVKGEEPMPKRSRGLRRLFSCASLGALALGVGAIQPAAALSGKLATGLVDRVLLISIDGMHALDFANCANGIASINGGAPYCPNLAALSQHGTNYTVTSTSR